jgi:hypothetical protein
MNQIFVIAYKKSLKTDEQMNRETDKC